MTYDNNKVIPQDLIDECNRRCKEDNKTYFIFDELVRNTILKEMGNKDAARDLTISEIIDDTNFYVGGDITEFDMLPSIMSYYDTETKLVGRYDRYKFIIDYITRLGFKPGLSNIGLEYEQAFTLSCEEEAFETTEFTIRIKPNMFYSLISTKIFRGSISGMVCSNTRFFNKGDIISFISTSVPNYYRARLRDILLEDVLTDNQDEEINTV